MSIDLNDARERQHLEVEGEGVSRLLECVESDVNVVMRDNAQVAHAYYLRGLKAQLLGRFAEAIDLYSHALRQESGYVGAYVNRGNAYARIKMYEAALADYGVAIELDRQCGPAHLNRGIAFYECGLLEKALRDFGRAQECEPQGVMQYYHRGNTLKELGLTVAALREYESALCNSPPSHYSLQALIREAIDKTKAELEVDGNARRILDDKYLFARCLRLLVNARRYEDALKGFLVIAERGCASEVAACAAYNAACSYALSGNVSQAAIMLAKAVEFGMRSAKVIESDPDLMFVREEPVVRALIGKLRHSA